MKEKTKTVITLEKSDLNTIEDFSALLTSLCVASFETDSNVCVKHQCLFREWCDEETLTEAIKENFTTENTQIIIEE